MKVLVQRSGASSVIVNNRKKEIEKGLVLLVGFTSGDNLDKINYLVNKIINLRIFPDNSNVMNKSILEVGGSVLSISQFTLYADTKKGNRPSYINALENVKAKELYELFNEKLRERVDVVTGEFGEDMIINIENIGPTTILLER